MGEVTLDRLQSSLADSLQLSLRGPDLLDLTPITRNELPDQPEVPTPTLTPAASTPTPILPLASSSLKTP